MPTVTSLRKELAEACRNYARAFDATERAARGHRDFPSGPDATARKVEEEEAALRFLMDSVSRAVPFSKTITQGRR